MSEQRPDHELRWLIRDGKVSELSDAELIYLGERADPPHLPSMVVAWADLAAPVMAALARRLQAAKREALNEWLETTFREAVADDARVLAAAAVMKVGLDRGDGPAEIVRRCIAWFMVDLIKPGLCGAEEANQNPNPNPQS